MRVKYATQVFSESFSVALFTLIATQALLVGAKFTAWSQRMDKLYDSLNSSVLKKQGQLRCAVMEKSEHHACLELCMNWIVQWHFCSPQDKQSHTIKCTKIKALLLLWSDLRGVRFYSCFHSSIAARFPGKLFCNSLSRTWLQWDTYCVAIRGSSKTYLDWRTIQTFSRKLRSDNKHVPTAWSVFALLSPSSTPTTSHSRQRASDSSGLQASSQDATDIVYENFVCHVIGTLVKNFLRTAECTCERTLLAADRGFLHSLHYSGRVQLLSNSSVRLLQPSKTF